MRKNVGAEYISGSLKNAAGMLNYPAKPLIPYVVVELMHFPWLAFLTHKFRRWTAGEKLHNFWQGMSQSMKKVMGFVNISGWVYHDNTLTVMTEVEYDNAAATSKGGEVE